MTSAKPAVMKSGIPNQNRLNFTPNTATSLSQPTPDYWQAAPRAFMETTPHSFHSPAVVQQSQSQPQFRPGMMESALDQDSIFSEFDAMDANLWSNTWEQSLLNLGFTNDVSNVDEEFYSFFGNETKPAAENFNVFEQPLSNVQAKAGVGTANTSVPGGQFDGAKKTL